MVILNCCGSLFHTPRPVCEKVLAPVQTSFSSLIKTVTKQDCQLLRCYQMGRTSQVISEIYWTQSTENIKD